jgi:dihydrofolate synthase/folylpolyglutamate synthase
MVVETGMGGRLDSTNVLDPLVSIINIIELEHTGFLGNTITEIAGEKAGIIKQNKPLILAKQNEEALDVFMRKTKEKSSPLFYLPDIAELSNVNVNQQGTDFTLSFKKTNNFSPLFSDPLSLSINIPGKIQAENAALAIAALKIAFPKIGEDTVCVALKNLNIPGRFEKISEEPLFIIDGAHTQRSLELCIETFCSLYGESGVLIFGCAADKDEKAMAKVAHSHFSKIIITTPGTFKASSPESVHKAFATQAVCGTLLITNTKAAVIEAMKFAREKKLPILGAGSFYLVSEIRNIIMRLACLKKN